MALKKKILVAGGAGFIGSHLCYRLIDEGYEVTCLDNLSSGAKKNIAGLLHHPSFRFVHHDIVYPYHEEVDEIYNLACPASPVQYQSNPVGTTKASVIGSINLLELAYKVDAKILLASTSEVYGDPAIHPQHEKYWGNVNPIGLRSCYDEGKRCAESLFMDYHWQYDIPIKIIRIFNTYGPRMAQNDGRVVSNFIMQALRNKDITIYGSGRQTRSFQYVDDLIEGMVRMMNSRSEFVGPVNIGNPEEFTILELAEKIISLTGSASVIEHKPLPMDDPKQRKPDITLARERLKWEPQIGLDEGLKKMIGFYLEELESDFLFREKFYV